jgi:hypothetical protein
MAKDKSAALERPDLIEVYQRVDSLFEWSRRNGYNHQITSGSQGQGYTSREGATEAAEATNEQDIADGRAKVIQTTGSRIRAEASGDHLRTGGGHGQPQAVLEPQGGNPAAHA